MQRFSRTIPGKEPITEEERILAAAWLAHTLGEAEDHDDEEDESEEEEQEERGRNRGRGRGRH